MTRVLLSPPPSHSAPSRKHTNLMEADHPHTISRDNSTPPEASETSTPAPNFSNTPPPPPNRKRKHAAISSATGSPAPPDQGLVGAQAAGASVLTDNKESAETDTRPRLTESRPPVFVPVGDGSEFRTTEQIAVNRLGFRYIPAGLSPLGSKLNYRMIESNPKGYVRVSWEDRSPFVKVTEDGMRLCGEKGYRSARLNVPIREGKWYLEVKVEHGGGAKMPDSMAKEGAHVRLGWGRREAMLNCPVGLDGYSYGYLDKDGRKVTLSRPKPYGRPFASGDTVGLYISLPPKRKPDESDPYDPAHQKRERIAIDFKGQAYFESVEYPQSREMAALMDSATNKAKDTTPVASVSTSKKGATTKNVSERGSGRGGKSRSEPAPLENLPILSGSTVAFFVNGESQGIAFQDIYDYLQLRSIPSQRSNRNKRRQKEGYVEHTDNPFDDGWLGYYPFISLFNGARVRINAGPDFEFPPPLDIDGHLAGDDNNDTKERTWRPLCDRYDEFIQEQRALDERDEAIAKELTENAPPPPPPKKEGTPAKVLKTGQKAKEPRKNTPAKSKAAAKPPLEVKLDEVAESSNIDPSLLPPAAEKPSASGEGQSSNQNGAELTEEERKLAARRERKRELERARRARQREEKLRQKQLMAEASLREAEDAAQAAAMAAAQARMAAAGFPTRPLTSNSFSASPPSSTEPTPLMELPPQPLTDGTMDTDG